MAKEITDVRFDKDLLAADADYLLKGVDVAAASFAKDKVFQIGNVQGGVEIVAVAATDIVVKANKTLVVNFGAASTKDGVATTVIAFTKGSTADVAIAKGTVIGRYIPGPQDGAWFSASGTSDATNSGTLDVFVHPVSR